MIESAVFLESFIREKPQRVTRAFARLSVIDPAALRANAECRQTKTGGGNAGNVAMILIQGRAVHSGAVGHQTCPRISLFPKIVEGAMLQVFKKLFVLA